MNHTAFLGLLLLAYPGSAMDGGGQVGIPVQERQQCGVEGVDPWVAGLRDRVMTYDGLARFAVDRFGALTSCEGAVTAEFDGSRFGKVLLGFPEGVSLEVETMPVESSVTTLRSEKGFQDGSRMRQLLEEYTGGMGLEIDWSAAEVHTEGTELIQQYWDPDPGLNASASLIYSGDRLVAVRVSLAL